VNTNIFWKKKVRLTKLENIIKKQNQFIRKNQEQTRQRRDRATEFSQRRPGPTKPPTVESPLSGSLKSTNRQNPAIAAAPAIPLPAIFYGPPRPQVAVAMEGVEQDQQPKSPTEGLSTLMNGLAVQKSPE